MKRERLLGLAAFVAVCASCSILLPGRRLKLDLNERSSIACIGDSLTEGYGASGGESYPACLQKKVTMPVVNLGHTLDTTADALERIRAGSVDEDVVIVVVELGANDFFRGRDVWVVEDNFRQMLDILEKDNRKIYIARFYTKQIASEILDGKMDMYNEFEQMYENLQDDYDFRLIADIWGNVWGNESLMYDSVHPNAAGYEAMADNYFRALEPVLKYNNLTL